MARLALVPFVLGLVAATAGGGSAAVEDVRATHLTRPQIVTQLPRALSIARMRADLLALERIADRSGGTRAAATAGYRESVSYVRAQLRRAGYNARAQRFPFAEYRETVERGTQIAPTRRALPIEALEYSPSTPPGGLRARLVPSGDGCEANDFDGVGRAIALIRRGTCFFAVKARNAAAAGATAALIFNTEQGPFDGTLGDPQAATIPVAAIAGALGTELAGSPNTIFELELVARNVRSSSQNVVADVRPGARRVLVVGAHLDSVLAGPGINDNATGATAVLEMARVVRARFPGLAVRFAFWGAEEAGLFGSRAYVSTAPKSEIVGYLNFDVLGSRSGEYGIYQALRRALARVLRAPRYRRSGDRHRRTLGSRALRAGRSSRRWALRRGLRVLPPPVRSGLDHRLRRARDARSGAAWAVASFAPLDR